MKKLILICILSANILLANNNTMEINLEHNTSSKNPLEITLKVTNTSDDTIQIIPSNFAYDNGEIIKDVFTILEDGEKVPYIGPIALIPKPKKKTLAAYKSYEGHVNLEEFYQLKPGTHIYEIYYGKKDNNLSNALEIETTITKKKKRDVQRARRRTCSYNQLSALHSYLNSAKSYALNAKNNLRNSPRGHALYQKWFGTATPGRYNTVYVYYSNIYYGLGQNVTYNCRVCQGNTLAFVHPNRPYEINICNIYWSQHPLSLRPAVLVHEMSHFTNIAGTIDGDGTVGPDGYGSHTGINWAKYIAQTNPAAAIHNAYSYEYYAHELAQSGGNNGGGNGGGSSNLHYEFNNGNAQGWRYRNLNQAYGGPHNGAWFFQAKYNDPQLISPHININANVIKKVTIRMANGSTSPYYSYLQLFWRNGNNGYSESRSKIISVTNHGGWTTYTIDMSNDYRWRGNISQIRIDPLTRGDGHWIGIDYIYLHQ